MQHERFLQQILHVKQPYTGRMTNRSVAAAGGKDLLRHGTNNGHGQGCRTATVWLDLST